MEDAAGTPEATKYYSIAGQRVAMNGAEGLQYLLTDHLGSVSAVLNASGGLVSEQRYLPFGGVRPIDQGITETDFAFTGQRNLAAVGLMDYNARWYGQTVGAFTQPDSIVPGFGNPQNLNRYAYTGNNPIIRTDPSGHSWCEYQEACNSSGGGYSSNVSLGELLKSGGPLNGRNPDGSTNPALRVRFCVTRPESCQADEPEKSVSPDEVIEFTATIFDGGAAALNAGYAFVGDIVGFYCPACYPGVVGLYQYYSILPNSLSTIAAMLWVGHGFVTGENDISINRGTEESSFSLSVSQDTILALGTNIAGWTVLREPNVAAAVDVAVFSYDIGRLGIPGTDLSIPSWINPSIKYNTNSGWDYSWR